MAKGTTNTKRANLHILFSNETFERLNAYLAERYGLTDKGSRRLISATVDRAVKDFLDREERDAKNREN